MKRLLVVAFLCLFATVASASQDTLAERTAAANRYLKAVPMSSLLDDSFNAISQQLPVEQRAEFLSQMKSLVNVKSLEGIARQLMIKHFTTAELNALADFYSSKEGASIMKKFGPYMSDVMPAVQAELMRALQQMQQQGM